MWLTQGIVLPQLKELRFLGNVCRLTEIFPGCIIVGISRVFLGIYKETSHGLRDLFLGRLACSSYSPPSRGMGLQSQCKLCGRRQSYGSDTERVAQYVMRYATRGTHVYQFVVNVFKEETLRTKMDHSRRFTRLTLFVQMRSYFSRYLQVTRKPRCHVLSSVWRE